MMLLQASTTADVTSVAAKATLLLGIGWCGTLLLRRAPAAVRHLVWLIAMAGALLALAMARVAPVRVAMLPALPAVQATIVPSRDASATRPVRDAGTPADTRATPTPAVVARADRSGGRARERSPLVSAHDYARLAVVIWLSVAAALLGWLVVGMVSVRRILHEASALDSAEWTAALREASARLGLTVAPRLVVSDRVGMAFVCDVLAPTIVVPVEAHGWSDDRRRAVLLHEMAHVRRHDLIGHAIARLTCAVYWFHPLVWVAAHRLRAESERACDDLVLDSGMRASDYAQHLLDMVAGLGYDRGAPASALPMARRNEFEGRLHAILDRAKRRPTLGHTRFGVLAAVFGFLAMSVAAVAPVRRVAAPSAAAAARPFDDAPHINTSATLNPLGRNLDVTAQPAARDTTVIRGRVIGPDGMPIQNAFVTVTYPNGMLYSARTNADGRYLIAGVNSRDFTMVITATGLHIYGPVRWEREAASGHPEEFTIYDAVTGDSTGTRVYSKTFDDTVDWVPRYAADVVIDATLVKSSDPSAFQDYLPDYLPPVETTVALAPAATITGRVIDARTASPIPGVAVYMPNTTYKDSTTSEGTYTLKDVPYGIYELEARLSGYAPAHIVDLHVRQATVTADITMVKSGGSPPTTWQQTLDSVGFTARKAHNIGGWFYQDGEAVAYHAHFNGADIVRDTLFIGVGDGLFIGGAVTPIPGFAVIQSVDSGGAQVSVIRWRSPSTPGGACVSFWVNGQPSVESRPGQIDHVIDTKAGEAIEAYSPMDTPSEFFQPTRSDCATIVIWIRAAIH